MHTGRIFIGAALCWLVLFGGNSSAQETQASIMFVNLDMVFTNFHKTRATEAQLKEQAEQIKEERQELIERFQALQAELESLSQQSQSAMLTEEARAVKRAEAEDKLLEARDLEGRIRRFDESAQRRLEEQSRRARRRLVDEMNALIREHAISRGYLAIIDVSGESLNQVPTVIYYQPRYDITQEIIAVVNARQ